MKNRKLIRTLKKERRKLYPHGFPFVPRGYGKTFLHMAHVLRYMTYYVAIDTYKKMDREVSLEEAHKYMNDFISEIWEEVMK